MRGGGGGGGGDRREFLRRLGSAALLLPAANSAPARGLRSGGGQQQDSLAGRGAVGTLHDPTVVGRPRAPTASRENDPEIQAIEQRLACNCGCTLDVFTCRTTDFSCTYSPRLHREVLALRAQGKSAQEILDAFVAEYGEKALMAPKASGFNWLGYLTPGVVIAVAGAALLRVIVRRRTRPAAKPPERAAPTSSATPEELDRLRRALAEVED